MSSSAPSKADRSAFGGIQELHALWTSATTPSTEIAIPKGKRSRASIFEGRRLENQAPTRPRTRVTELKCREDLPEDEKGGKLHYVVYSPPGPCGALPPTQ